MKECGLQQAGLAQVMGVPLDRVKSLTSGKVKNLKREESEALITKLGVRAAWLVTGEGPMRSGEEAAATPLRQSAEVSEVSVISELLKRVMVEYGLRQVDLADVLGVSLSRVKAMTSGRVKNLTREESEALVGKLGVRAAWLVTGVGPMRNGEDAAVNTQPQLAEVAAIDVELLTQAIAAVEKIAQHRGRVLEPAKKAQVIVQLYQALVSGQDGAAMTQALANVA